MENKNIILLESIDASDAMLFQKNYLMNEKPVILKGMGKDWPAIRRWSADFFRNTYGHVKVPVCYYKTKRQELYKDQTKMPLGEYIYLAERNNAFDNNAELPYLGGWIYHKEFPELLDDIDMTLPCFPDNWLYKLPSSISIPPTNLLIGYQHVSSPLHTDSFFVNSVLTMIVGEKKARLVSPSHTFAVSNGQDLFNVDIANEVLKQNGIPCTPVSDSYSAPKVKAAMRLMIVSGPTDDAWGRYASLILCPAWRSESQAQQLYVNTLKSSIFSNAHRQLLDDLLNDLCPIVIIGAIPSICLSNVNFKN